MEIVIAAAIAVVAIIFISLAPQIDAQAKTWGYYIVAGAFMLYVILYATGAIK